jgi:hypothetical protein
MDHYADDLAALTSHLDLSFKPEIDSAEDLTANGRSNLRC